MPSTGLTLTRHRALQFVLVGLLALGASLAGTGCGVFGSNGESDGEDLTVPTFTEMNAGLTGVRNGSSSVDDVNNDGHLDLLITGVHGQSPTASLYLGDGSGGFTETNANLTGVGFSSSAIGDVNGDGNADLVLTGFDGTGDEDGTGNETATLYLGDGQGGFTTADAGLTGVSVGTTSFGDVNGDENLDLLITGSDPNTEPSTTLYLGDGQGGFTEAGAGLRGVDQGSSSFGDVDGDGTLDLLVTGGATILYLGDGRGGFTAADAGLTDVAMSTASMGDVDDDGSLDLLISGFGGTGAVTRLYLGDGAGRFTDAKAGLTGLVRSASSIGDLNNDDNLDLLLLGDDGSSSKVLLYLGDGQGGFTEADVGGLEAVLNGVSSLGDVDEDGDLDLLLTGHGTATLYENHAADEE